MPKIANNTKPRRNPTEERLRATPFDNIARMEAEEEAIRLSAWQRMTEVKVFSELLTKPEFTHVKEELKAGLSCGMSSTSKERIYKIFSEGKGMKLELNETYVQSLGDHQIPLIQGAIEAGITGWGTLFWQAKGLLPRASSDAKEALAPKGTKKG